MKQLKVTTTASSIVTLDGLDINDVIKQAADLAHEVAGDKPVGFAKEGMLTYITEDDGSTKDSGAWEWSMHHSYEITGGALFSKVGDTIRELLVGTPCKVDVEIRREMGKMPRKMKKAYRTGSRYRRDTKWKRKAKAYKRRAYRLPDAELVVTREQMGVIEATIKGSSLQRNPELMEL